MSIVRDFFYYRPSLDKACCLLFKQNRLDLPFLSLPQYYGQTFSEETVRFGELPKGRFSTPLRDLVFLLKVVCCTAPDRILEVGSYRGYTALLMAQHVDEDATIVTVDQKEDHGEAYRGTPYAEMVDRRVGWTSEEMFSEDEDGSYDLIYVDASHDYEAVKRDTELLLPLLSSEGILLWHDYANWGYFSEKNGVPEYLSEFAETRTAAQIDGTALAAYAPSWEDENAERFREALMSDESKDPWTSVSLRG